MFINLHTFLHLLFLVGVHKARGCVNKCQKLMFQLLSNDIKSLKRYPQRKYGIVRHLRYFLAAELINLLHC